VFEFKPDYAQSKARIDAFWECELIDRPVVQFLLARPIDERVPVPAADHASAAACWMDAEYQAERALAELRNQEFLGDSMPVAFPNLGPEVFSAFYGCPLHFGNYGTSWSEPILTDWDQASTLHLDWEHPYLEKLLEMTDALLAIGQGKFITGMPDWHAGGDAIAAIRNPQHLAIDMIEHVDEVKQLLARIEADYFQIYDHFYHKLRGAGLPISTWLPLVSDAKYYIPSNDFSIMISTAMFEEIFLPGIIRECQFLDRTIYHLDGPGALRHLDSILSIAELDALQYVPGAGNEGYHKWVEVYRRAQAKGKAIEIFCTVQEVDAVMETLDPHGVYLNVSDVPSREVGQAMLKRLETWGSGRIHPVAWTEGSAHG
jgi:hypothetical protein